MQATEGPPVDASPLMGAVTHLEHVERELVAQHTAAMTDLENVERELGARRAEAAARVATLAAQLEATRAGIKAMRPAMPEAAPPPLNTRTVRGKPAPHEQAAALARGHAGKASAEARCLAILRLLSSGTVPAPDLRTRVPMPEGATAHQHRQSITNALTRLKGEGLVVRGAGGWSLTAKGRKRDAAASKEAP